MAVRVSRPSAVCWFCVIGHFTNTQTVPDPHEKRDIGTSWSFSPFRVAAAEPDPNHAHTKLGLKSITTSPQTMSDDKTNAYVKMALAKKV